MNGFQLLLCLLRAWFVNRTRLALENLSLRQQLARYKQQHQRPKLVPWDRIFWVWLSRLWSDWRSALVIVKPETVIRAVCHDILHFCVRVLGTIGLRRPYQQYPRDENATLD